MRDQKRAVSGIIILITLSNFLISASAYIFKLICDQVDKMPDHAWTDSLVVFVVIFAAVRLIGNTLVSYYKEVKPQILLKTVENRFPAIAHWKYMILSLAYHNRFNVGEKISRIEKGYTRLESALGDLLIAMIPQSMFLLMNFALIIWQDWQLGLLFMFPFAPAAFLNYQVRKKFQPMLERVEMFKQERSGIISQSLLNIQTVKQYGQAATENNKVRMLSDRIRDLEIVIARKMQIYYSAISGLLEVFFCGTIVWAMVKCFRQELDWGTVIFISIVGGKMFHFLWMFIHCYVRFLKNMAAVEEVMKLLREKADIKSPKNAVRPGPLSDRIRYDNVSFSYDDFGRRDHEAAKIFDGLSIEIAAGRKTAIVGLSGVGKTTLLNLLCRYYDVGGGAITYDGVDIRRLDLDAFNKLFANVLQEPAIFDTTLRENICFPCRVVGDPKLASVNVTDKEIGEALMEAGFAEALGFDKGLDSMVGERGVKLSGGQRQRLELARAILAVRKGARILILDEPTSNLDPETEAVIHGAITRLRQEFNITVIAVAHRLSTIRDADKIIVLDAGQVLEEGTHNELMARNGKYAGFVNKQWLER